MPKRKEDVAAKTSKLGAVGMKGQERVDHELIIAQHHDTWLANIVGLVVVLVFGVYVLLQRDAMQRTMVEMGARLQQVEAECAAR